VISSRILSFYRGGTDDEGRTLVEILGWDRERLEDTHDYIQWLFPLRERSAANPDAPLLSAADVRAFRTDAALQACLLDALRLMLGFYALELVEHPTPHVRRRGDFDIVAASWLRPFNHNFLRLTRILRSLRTLGLDSHARLLFEALRAIHDEHRAVVGEQTYGYWTRAMLDPSLTAD
jgi:hypothetical protein